MDSLAVAMITAQQASADSAYGPRSALPNAPVVPHVDHVPVARMRRTVAGALRKLADAVAPPRAAGTAAGRHTLPAGS
jgi:hypothetical protein